MFIQWIWTPAYTPLCVRLRQMIMSLSSMHGSPIKRREKRSGMRCGISRTTILKSRTYKQSNTKHINTTRRRGDSDHEITVIQGNLHHDVQNHGTLYQICHSSSHLGSSGHVSVLAHTPSPLTPYNILY